MKRGLKERERENGAEIIFEDLNVWKLSKTVERYEPSDSRRNYRQCAEKERKIDTLPVKKKTLLSKEQIQYW